MIADCLNQYACLAANINFNVDGLLKSFWQLTIDGLSWGAIYALVAVGYTLVFGVLRLINFAHSEIFMLGMFGAYFCLDMILGFTPSGNAYNKGVLLTVFYLGIAMLFTRVRLPHPFITLATVLLGATIERVDLGRPDLTVVPPPA